MIAGCPIGIIDRLNGLLQMRRAHVRLLADAKRFPTPGSGIFLRIKDRTKTKGRDKGDGGLWPGIVWSHLPPMCLYPRPASGIRCGTVRNLSDKAGYP